MGNCESFKKISIKQPNKKTNEQASKQSNERTNTKHKQTKQNMINPVGMFILLIPNSGKVEIN